LDAELIKIDRQIVGSSIAVFYVDNGIADGWTDGRKFKFKGSLY